MFLKIIFYGTLAAMVVIHGRSQEVATQNDTNPVLSFIPMNKNENESTLIWVKSGEEGNWRNWSDSIRKSLDRYYTPFKNVKNEGSAIMDCLYGNGPAEGKVCFVDLSRVFPCDPSVYYVYGQNAACIFLKLDQITGWTPEVYNDTDNLPAEMPRSLKEHIRHITKPERRNNIWISCEGENPADIENLGPVTYYPRRGFPGYYFPYKDIDGYLSPLVAVHFQRPMMGVVINIECRAWAKNIKYNREKQLGSVHLELLID